VVVCGAFVCELYEYSMLSIVSCTTVIYTLSLHDALPIWRQAPAVKGAQDVEQALHTLLTGSGLQGRVEGGMLTVQSAPAAGEPADRKSTRLNSSHVKISYAVFCLKKKKKY